MKSNKKEKNIKTNIYLEDDYIKLKSLLLKYKISNKKVCLIIDKGIKSRIIKEIVELFKENNSIFIYKDKPKEKKKNLFTLNKIIKLLSINNFDNGDIIVGFGGGNIIDLSGVACGIYNKKLDLVILPTTLSSMVNYSVMYDFCLNIDDKVNVLSLSLNPLFVYDNLYLLNYLNYDKYILGIVSVIRLALIKEKKLFQFIEKRKEDIIDKNINVLHYIINQTINIKKYFYKLRINNNKDYDNYNFGIELAYLIQEIEHLNYKYDYALAISIIKLSEIKEFKNLNLIKELFKYFKFDIDYKKDIMKEFIKKYEGNKKVNITLLSKIGKAYKYNYAIK